MFAKIFNSIFDSSIADDWKTRIVFQDMLVLADNKGIVEMTPTAIARRTNIPLEIILEAIPKLEAPDTASRTPDHEGRRLLRLDAHREWGWQIVNFVKYRESATKEMLRMAEADRKRAYRAKFHRGEPSPTPPTDTKTEKQRESSPVTSPGLSRTNPPVLKIAERIDYQKTLERINKQLEKYGPISGHDVGTKSRNHIVELQSRKATILKLLGEPA